MPTDLGVTRRRRSSGGSSTPVTATAAPRSSSSDQVPARTSARVPRSSAAGCRYGSTSTRPSMPERGHRRGDGAFRADRQGRRDEELRPVPAQVARRRRGLRRVEVRECHRAVAAHDDPAAVDPSVRDAGVVERDDGAPHGARACRRRDGRARARPATHGVRWRRAGRPPAPPDRPRRRRASRRPPARRAASSGPRARRGTAGCCPPGRAPRGGSGRSRAIRPPGCPTRRARRP